MLHLRLHVILFSRTARLFSIKLSSGFILAFTGHRLLLCVALVRDDETPNYWSTSIGRDGVYSYIYATHWTTKLSYVCQYHSKSLHGLRLSVYQSVNP